MTTPKNRRFAPQFPFNYAELDENQRLVVNIPDTVSANITNDVLPTNITNDVLDVQFQSPQSVVINDTIDVNLTNDPLTAFGETLTAQNHPVTGWTFAYNINAELIRTLLTGSGGATTTNGIAVISTGAAINSSADISTYRTLRYVPGEGAVARFTAIFTPGVAGSQQHIGVGDDTDGFFFGFDGTRFGVLRRSNSVDHWTYQEDWNENTLSELDITKGNVYEIVYQWLGFGMIRFNIEDSETGRFVNVHKIAYANLNTDTSIRNPSLPLHAHVINTSNNTNIIIKTSSAMGFVQGFYDLNELHPLDLHRAFVSQKTLATTNETGILAIKGAATYQGIFNRVRCKLGMLSAAADGTKPVIIRLYKNATISGGSYTDFSANTSTLSYNTGLTSFSGGTLVNSFQLGKAEGRTIYFDTLSIKVGYNDTLLLTSQSSGANYDINGSICMVEQF